MSTTPKPTPEQQYRLDMIKKEFGAAMHKTYSISRTTGIMRVKLKAQAGWWHWSYNRQGDLVYSCLNMELPLEGTNADTARPGALFDAT